MTDDLGMFRALLPLAKWYCRNLRNDQSTNSKLIARANRELRYDRLNSRRNRHAAKWSDEAESREMTNPSTPRHAAYVFTESEMNNMHKRYMPLMFTSQW